MASYQVLARKYRPQQFPEVVGQEHIVRTLKNAISQKRIAHAYLFVGPRGTGKTTLARIFAKALNCSAAKEPTLQPCDQCSQCKEIMEGRSLDVLEIDGASNRGIDHVRELRETVRYLPASARFKVVYIDEVHMITTEAFNALLKTLEEPPPHVKFLFATTDPQKIPATILSRCQRFDLQRIPNDLIIKQLQKIASLEKIEISETALLAIARSATGGLRDAESVLDQMIAFCGNKIEEKEMLSIFGLAARDQVRQLTESMVAGNRSEAITLVSTLAAEGKDLPRLLGELTDHFRNVLVVQSGAEVSGVTEAEISEIKGHAGQMNRARALRILEILTEAEGQMKYSLSKKIILEVTLLKAIETRDEVLLEEVLARLRGPETAAKGRPAGDREPAGETERKELGGEGKEEEGTRQREEGKEQKGKGGANLETLWIQLKEEATKSASMLGSNLIEGRLLSMDSSTLVIGFDREFEFQKNMVDTPANHGWLQNKLQQLLHKPMNVKVVFADDPTIPGGEEIAREKEEKTRDLASPRFENDPMIKKALEIFKGEIVNIKR